jgi:hypothetical protein
MARRASLFGHWSEDNSERGMSREQLKRLKELETENQRLKRVVADLSLDKIILTEAARGIPLTGSVYAANAERAVTKEALAIKVKRRLNSTDMVDPYLLVDCKQSTDRQRSDLFILRDLPEFIRSDNGADLIAKKVTAWIGAVGAKTASIAPGSLWENECCESFNARYRPSHGLPRKPLPAMDEILNGGVFYTLREEQILIERWRQHYNTVRPRSALGSPAGAGKLDAHRTAPHPALTFKLDHPM